MNAQMANNEPAGTVPAGVTLNVIGWLSPTSTVRSAPPFEPLMKRTSKGPPGPPALPVYGVICAWTAAVRSAVRTRARRQTVAQWNRDI